MGIFNRRSDPFQNPPPRPHPRSRLQNLAPRVFGKKADKYFRRKGDVVGGA